MKSLSWLLRGVLALGGVILAVQAWPVTRGAWEAQKADTVVTKLRHFSELRGGQPATLSDVIAGIGALDRAVAADPVAGLYLLRSELVAGAALAPDLGISLDQRIAWLRSAESDLVAGLGNAPARGVAWGRLAAVRQGLQGTSRGVVDALIMSIDTSPMLSSLWVARLQMISDNWVAFTPKEREQLGAYVVRTWRSSTDRYLFTYAIRSPIDELLIRYFLRDEPKAQDELAALLARKNPK
ncbi:MAG: hypothetical protein PSV46_08660 [Reyranella sp.]|nr:hypothetical protein [Reyranella sp.]